MKIGITERGDCSLDFSWVSKMNNMDGVILITKNLTDKVIEEAKPYFDKIIFHITCTGYGGTVLEPNIPNYENQLNQAVKLLDMNVSTERIVIRVDPIIPTDKGLKKAEKVILKAIELGFNRFRISLIDMYPHVRERFKENGLPLPYGDYFTPLNMLFQKIDKWLKVLKNQYPFITIESCAEGKLLETEQLGCVSRKDFELLGLDLDNIDSIGYQRKGCLCCSAKTELLSKKEQCPYKCLYCYWK